MIAGAAHTHPTDSDWVEKEREILKQLIKGERRDLGCLIDHYGEELMRYLFAILGRRELAEDVFQDTWVKVMERIDRFDSDRKFSPWLFRIARNCAYDRFRQHSWKRWLSLSRTDHEHAVPEIRAPGDFRQNLLTSNLADALLVGLEPVLRELIHLRFFKDMSYEEIAGHCKIPLGTVKSRLARAMDQLARRYQQIGGSAYV